MALVCFVLAVVCYAVYHPDDLFGNAKWMFKTVAMGQLEFWCLAVAGRANVPPVEGQGQGGG